jgi:hypothetical protein
MTDDTRLAEIEARVKRWELMEDAEVENGEYVSVCVGNVVSLRESDYDWLIARVRALEAQAALDGAVVEAAQLLCNSRRMFAMSPGPDCGDDAMAAFGVYRECERILDAALAARDLAAKEV